MRIAFALAILLALSAGTAGAAQAAVSIPACPDDADPMQGWSTRAPPRKIFGDTYYVGTCGISSILVASPQGHVLIDGATDKAAPLIEANIRALGFKLRDVKYILNSHEHSDHAGGIAQLQRDTGAQVLAGAADELSLGRNTRYDPQFLDLSGFPPVDVAAMEKIRDSQTVHAGDLALTAHATPGHAPGSTSWTWQSCEGTRCLNIAYADSLSAISDKHYRYVDHPAYVTAFRHSIDTVASLSCDILLTPHPAASDLFARFGGKVPLVDAGACKRYADNARSNLEQRLQDEKNGTKP